MSSLEGKTDLAKLKKLCKKPYAFQAKWFLNAFWEDGPGLGGDKTVLESVWTYAQNMTKLDKNGAKGCELEEFTAHRFLEKNTEALTWTDMRGALKELDIDFDKKVSLTEFLVHHFKVDWKKLVNAIQGSNKLIVTAEKACAEAQKKRDLCVQKLNRAAADEEAAQNAADEARQAANVAHEKAEAAKEAAKQARKDEEIAHDAKDKATTAAAEAEKAEKVALNAEAVAKKAEESSLVAEESSKKAAEAAKLASEEAKAAHDLQLEAEAEVKAILARIKGYQDALKKRADALQAIIDDDSVGQVKKMKAKHELMDLKNGSRARRKGISECNPELLNKAKIDQKAAVRKQKKATSEAKAKADVAKEASDNATREAKNAEAARKEAEQRRKESEATRVGAVETRKAAVATKKESEAKAEQASKTAEVAKAKHDESEEKRQIAVAKKEESEKQKEQATKTRAAAEDAVEDAEKAMDAAQTAFQEAKKNAKGGEGTMWWMGRDLEEQKKYLPRAAFNRLKRKHDKKIAAVRAAASS